MEAASLADVVGRLYRLILRIVDVVPDLWEIILL